MARRTVVGRGHTHYDNSRGFLRAKKIPWPTYHASDCSMAARDAPVHRAQGERFFCLLTNLTRMNHLILLLAGLTGTTTHGKAITWCGHHMQ